MSSPLSSPCCPPESIGPIPISKKETRGTVVELTCDERKPMNAYVVGKLQGASRAVIVYTDVFGVDSGNHKVICDELAERLGDDTLVIMPDLFRGVAILGGWGLPESLTMGLALVSIVWDVRTRITYKNIESDLKLLVYPYLKKRLDGDETTIGCVGFCFGGWVVGRTLAFANDDDNDFRCDVGVAIHPSWKLETVSGSSPAALAKQVGTKPILFLPSKYDPEAKVDSPYVKQLAEQRKVSPDEISIEFPNMIHGWVTRGDDSNEEVAHDIEQALQLAVKFIKDFKV